jgi:hypothetical protein
MTRLLMGPKESGLTDQKLNLSKPIFGYSNKSTIKVDFDNTSFKVVKYWAFRAL